MSTNKYICIAPIKTESGRSRIEIGVEVVHETDDAIFEAQIKVEDEDVAPTTSVFLAEHVEPEEIRACRICLQHDCRLHLLRRDNLDEIYRQLTSLPLHEDDIFPHYVCVECTALLNKYQQFRTKSKKALTVLKSLPMFTKSITMENIRHIDRKANNLTSSLSIKQNPPEHFDYYITNNYLEVDIKTEHLSENEENENEVKGVPSKVKEVIQIEIDHSKIVKKPNEVRIKKSNKKKKFKPGESKHTTAMKEVKKAEGRNQVPKALFKGYFEMKKMTLEEKLDSIQMRKKNVSYKLCSFKCDVCFEAFDRKTTFDLHMSRHSEENGAFTCEVCHLRFSDRKGLARHEKLLHYYRYSCTKCPYTVDHCQGAKKHLRFHQGKTYIPQLPREKVIKNFKLEIKDGGDCPNQEKSDHRSITTEVDSEASCNLQEIPQDGERNYDCNSCDKTYKSLQALYYHKMAAHSGEKLYDCAQCGKRFAWYSNFKKHIRNLHKNNVFTCTECSKTFKSKTGLNQHVRHVHEKKPWPNTVKRAQLRLSSQRDDCTDSE